MTPASIIISVVLQLLLVSPLAFAIPLRSLAVNSTSSANGTHELTSTSYWLANIKRQGTVPFGGKSSSYQIYRNVKDFGAKGDGSTDDTAAINSAISSGDRCGQGCDSSTTSPAIVYFPPGTYVVSKPIVQYYYTQLIGDALKLPTIKAAASFQGIAVIDSDPYADGGVNWYVDTDNFYRQIRNFVVDLTAMPPSSGAGIHWQVAQATSLQNMVFNMVKGGGAANKQQGIFMDNGSGGFFSDLIFNGGNYGAFLGNQQFTTRNLTFNGCQTAIFVNYDWVWAFKSLSINNCQVGLNISNGGFNQTVGSVLIQDSKFSNTPAAIITSFAKNSLPASGGTMIIDNVDFTGSKNAVQDASGSTILAGGKVVQSWGQGRQYVGSSPTRIQGPITAPSKPAGLLDGSGKVYERSRPQYENVPASSFVSVKAAGAKGDGTTDDTAAIQKAANSIQSDQILYFDHGAYLVSDTVKVPANILITGEIWPLIVAKGAAFSDQKKPTAVFQVGQAGDSGAVEITDLIFEVIGPNPGAVLVEWNSGASSQGSNGMWDAHWRIGGSAGTDLQSNTCAKNPNVTAAANPKCEGAFMLMHITKTASVYMENTWGWVSDHELDLADHGQINIFNGRGILIESTAPVWLYGTAFEHSALYQYQVSGASSVYMSMIQTETPYYQPNPDATNPFTAMSNINDPTFAGCTGDTCKEAFGLSIVNSHDILVYGAGMYSFFNNYDQTCLTTHDCQQNMVQVSKSSNIHLMGISTVAAKNMIVADGVSQALAKDNLDTFCQTIALWTQGSK
ncbi:MAG: hypothetical protein M1828_001275 [Chrysothrix sp. TS-e1954]|nr:MAG: hypothetical protein M1828_001275 [Chrysothrix sp. TS-e1954]